MIGEPGPPSRKGLAPRTDLTLIQHNSWGSWDVFLSLFTSIAEGPPPTLSSSKTPPPPRDFSLVSQDLNLLPPPVGRPRVAWYESQAFQRGFAVLPSFPPETDDFMHQPNVKTTPGPPRGVMVPLVLLVHPDPP